MEAVIIAGGKGTRLASLSKETPKVLIKIGNKPVIEHQILLLKKYGVSDIHLLLGHLGSQIKNYLGDGEKWGVKIHYYQEEKPLGTAGALLQLKNKIKKDFLFLSGDIMMDFDVKRFISWHKKKSKKIASIVVHPSDHPFDSDLIETDKTDKVASLLLRPHKTGKNFQNLSIASVFIFSSDIFKYIPGEKKCDLEKGILPKILKAGENIYAYKTPEYIKDMGTPERLAQVKKDYTSGKIEKLNLRNKRRAVFIDRDGTLNQQDGQTTRLESFRSYDFTAKAIKKINQSNYLAIVITNQRAIAKGFLSEEELFLIHKKMETELGFSGAKIDNIYYCPHHQEKGFKGEVAELKIECNCRKPKTGMIKKAITDFNLDISRCFFIGDSTTDAKTAENAGIKFLGVETGYGCRDGKHKISKKFTMYKNLLEAIENII